MQSPQGPQGAEFQPAASSAELAPITPDQIPEKSPDKLRAPARQEVHNPASDGVNQNAGAPQFDASQLPQPIQPAVIPPTQHQDNQDDTQVVRVPDAADDVERIEPEWVNKAKSVVEKTKHDPYMQEREVSRLQADYLKKRYGKEIKLQDS
jgi:hypothetical protein